MTYQEIIKLNPIQEGESIRSYCNRVSGEHYKADALRSLIFKAAARNAMTTEDFLRSQGPAIVEQSVWPQDRELNWRDVIAPINALQGIMKDAKKDANEFTITVQATEPICVVVLADLHAMSWGTDHDAFEKITDELINTPNLYAILGGDLLQMAIKLRGVAEVTDNVLPPKWQMKFLDSWLKEVHHKVLFSIWDNHSVMREESGTGFSMYAHIFEQKVNYSNGITHADIIVGDQTYRIAAAHFWRGNSMYNALHGHMRYSKWNGHDRDIIIGAHTHQPAVAYWTESNMLKLGINSGSLQNSGYEKRFYSIHNHPVFPCFTLDPRRKSFQAYWSVENWLKR